MPLLNTISPLDLGWLFVESDKTPMHVGCVQIFDPPESAGPDYVAALYEQLTAESHCVPPFSLQMHRQGLGLPRWESVDEIDIEYHVQRWALAAPGDEGVLQELVGRLHAEALDLSRPLWEFHLIEGLADGGIAIYIKMHHALMDGIAGMRLMQNMLATEPTSRSGAPWSTDSPVAHMQVVDRPEAQAHHASLFERLRGVVGELRTLPGVSESLGSLAWAALHRKHSHLQAPYTAPRSLFNQRVTLERGFAMAQLSLTELRRVADHAGVSINDVLLAVCAGALRGYMVDHDNLPPTELLAGLPVSVRPPGDEHVGTAVSFIVAALGTHLTDRRDRLGHIHESTRAAKAHISGLSRQALTEYTLLMMAPYMAELASGLAGRVTPAFNIIVSNVPGPRTPLYFNGARLRAMYPLSIVTHGQALNITSLGYGDTLQIGMTYCPQRVPGAEEIGRKMENELAHLHRWATGGKSHLDL